MCDIAESQTEINTTLEEIGVEESAEVKTEKSEEVMEVIEGDPPAGTDLLSTPTEPVKLELPNGSGPFAKIVHQENADGSNIIPVKIGRKIVKLVRVNGAVGDGQNKQVIVIPDGRDEIPNVRNIKVRPTTGVTAEDNLITFLKEAIIKPFST